MLKPRVHVVVASRTIGSDPAGFSSLAKLNNDLSAFEGNEIYIDLERVGWLDGHLAGPLMVIVRRAEGRENIIRLRNTQQAITALLRKNRFLDRPANDDYKTTMPLTEFELEDGIEFSLYAKKYLDRPEMPRMSAALRGKFFEGIDELFANAALHSKSMFGVVVCGQFFPSKGRLDFVLADGGQGIPGSVNSLFPRQRFKDHEAISWAMEPFNTTRQGDIPGGLGSKLLREFVALNGGRLAIASQGGYWCQVGDRVMRTSLSYPYPGTSVLLEINTADRNKYDLASAPSPKEIW